MNDSSFPTREPGKSEPPGGSIGPGDARPESIKPADLGAPQAGAPAPSATAASRVGSPNTPTQLGGKDVAPLISGWDYEPGSITVRKINGADGTQKLQMRLDLGLLQMELVGRPDGQRPHGMESLLEYHESRLHDHEQRNGTDLGFELTPRDCQRLREEAVMYYHRYLSLFVLEDYSGVVRDTARNLRVLDLCGKFAGEEDDRYALEQYRPYIVMMNTRATAAAFTDRDAHAEALKVVDEGLASIKAFFERFDQEESFGQSNEVKVLRKLARDIRRKVPVHPRTRLQEQLDRAVRHEDYERAARLRDEIRAIDDAAPPARASQQDVSHRDTPPL